MKRVFQTTDNEVHADARVARKHQRKVDAKEAMRAMFRDDAVMRDLFDDAHIENILTFISMMSLNFEEKLRILNS